MHLIGGHGIEITNTEVARGWQHLIACILSLDRDTDAKTPCRCVHFPAFPPKKLCNHVTLRTQELAALQRTSERQRQSQTGLLLAPRTRITDMLYHAYILTLVLIFL